MVGGQEGHPACKMLGVGGDKMTAAAVLITTSIIHIYLKSTTETLWYEVIKITRKIVIKAERLTTFRFCSTSLFFQRSL